MPHKTTKKVLDKYLRDWEKFGECYIIDKPFCFETMLKAKKILMTICELRKVYDVATWSHQMEEEKGAGLAAPHDNSPTGGHYGVNPYPK